MRSLFGGVGFYKLGTALCFRQVPRAGSFPRPPLGESAGLHDKGDSRRMKKQITAFVLALALCLGLAVPASAAAGFSDVPASHWAYEQIDRAVEDGIVGGYQDGTFRPAAPVSYAAFSLMLARAFYPGELAAYPNGGTEAGEAIMNRHNILRDTSRMSRSSSSDLPREDMAQCMYNVLLDKGVGIPSVQEQCSHINSISDYNKVEYNCCTGVLVCYSLGLLGGQKDGSFGPKNSMNRAQAAVVIGRLRDYVQSNGGAAGAVEIPSGPEPKAPPVTEPAANPPAVTELPEFKLLPGENVQQMMARVCVTQYVEGYLADGTVISEDSIKAILAKAETTMPNHTTWDSDQRFSYRSPQFGRYWGNAGKCAGFAACLSDYIFSSDAPLRRHQNYEQLKIGDVIDIRNSENGYKHAGVVTSIDRASGTVYTCSGNSGGEVRWDGFTTFEILNRDTVASNTFVYSRY